MMESPDDHIAYALEHTRIVRPPRQQLATFGVTRVKYHLVTEPTYTEIAPTEPESVVREGVVEAQKPSIVTPGYLLNLEGFGDEARRSLDLLSSRLGRQAPGLMYAYKNEATGMEIVGGRAGQVADRIASTLDSSSKHLSAVIIGVDALWDVSLLKFIFEFTASSVRENVQELHGHGLLEPEPGSGLPRGAWLRVEELFQEAERGALDPAILKRELDRWNLFERYQDRFFALFRRRLR